MPEPTKKCIYQGLPAPVNGWGGDCSICTQDAHNYDCRTAIFASFRFYEVKSNGHDPKLTEEPLEKITYKLKKKKDPVAVKSSF